MPDLTEIQVAQAVALVEGGVSRRDVARRLGVSHSQVNRAVQRFHQDGTMRRRPGQGRRRKTTALEDRHMVRTAARSPYTTAREIASEHAVTTGVVVSSQTVRRRLRAGALLSRRPKKAPKLTLLQRRARRQYLQQYGDWGMQQWRRGVFSDEVRFCLFKCDGRIRVWRRRGQEVFDDNAVLFGGGSNMFWGAIGHGWKSELVLVPPPALTAERYIDLILGPHVVPQMQQRGEGSWYQQDNARPHIAIISRQYLEAEGVTLLNHPANSPDLNPIENLWDEVDRRVRRRIPQPASLEEMAVAVQEAWAAIPQDFINNLIASMPRRIAALRRSRGRNTRY